MNINNKANTVGLKRFTKEEFPEQFEELKYLNNITGKQGTFDWIDPITEHLYSDEFISTHTLEELQGIISKWRGCKWRKKRMNNKIFIVTDYAKNQRDYYSSLESAIMDAKQYSSEDDVCIVEMELVSTQYEEVNRYTFDGKLYDNPTDEEIEELERLFSK